ncbi:TPA: glycosyltransferase [Citrobacter freundii]
MSKLSKTPSVMSGLIKTLDTGRELPFVSVVTPTWNRAAFLPYLLYMYRYQDYPADRRELVILDDSPQSNQPIIDKLTQGHPEKFNIRYIYHPERLALGKKRNMLNELARGEYILCMDDDDYYPADKISYTIGMMQKHRALISGSDQIPIWYSHINRIFKTHSFGRQHIPNGTFCYHRNYLRKHRYDDECNIAEERSFTNNFTANPLQLPGERTILCISHSQNTFDKDFILGSNIALDSSIEQWVIDPMLKNWYQSLHNATHNQPIQWESIDQVVIINLDKRTDRLQQIQQELALLNFPATKITRLSACEESNGQLGRRRSHLTALQLAQEKGWSNYLLLEDDAIILKQEKHTRVLNSMLEALPRLPWEVILLGGEIKRGTQLKSLNGIIHARDCNKICAYLVNSRYYSVLEQQMLQDPSESIEAQWQPLLQKDKWLACYPSICYQRAGYSNIEEKETDNIRFYFNKINQRNQHSNAILHATRPNENKFFDSIGFYMETSFHYQVYKSIILALQAKGQHCVLLISDRVPKNLLNEMSDTIKKIENPLLKGTRLSLVIKHHQKFKCLISPYYTPELNGLSEIHIRAMYGLAKEEWNHAWWNAFYHQILCYSYYSQKALDINGTAVVVGNPKFDDWYNKNHDLKLPDTLKIDPKKPTILYAPTYGALSSIPHWAEQIGRLSHDYNIITKLHHGTSHRPEEKNSLEVATRHLKKKVVTHDLMLPLLEVADYVITDNSGFIFDAINAKKRVILLDWPGLEKTIDAQQSYSNEYSAEQRIRHILPTVQTISELRGVLSDSFNWTELVSPLDEIRHHYCDAFMDGKAGERAAQSILNVLTHNDKIKENHLLISLQGKLFS